MVAVVGEGECHPSRARGSEAQLYVRVHGVDDTAARRSANCDHLVGRGYGGVVALTSSAQLTPPALYAHTP